MSGCRSQHQLLSSMQDGAVVAALFSGDEETFERLVDQYHPAMVRIARHYVDSDAAACQLAEDVWPRMLQQLSQFQGASTLRSWLFRLLVEDAGREGKWAESADAIEPILAPPSSRAWEEEKLEDAEVTRVAAAALDALPPQLAALVELRDVEGLSAAEVSEALGIDAAEQRKRLHRARLHIHRALDAFFAPATGAWAASA